MSRKKLSSQRFPLRGESYRPKLTLNPSVLELTVEEFYIVDPITNKYVSFDSEAGRRIQNKGRNIRVKPANKKVFQMKRKLSIVPFLKPKVSFTEFRGNPIYETMSLLYLMKSHPECCFILPTKPRTNSIQLGDYSIKYMHNANRLFYPSDLQQQVSGRCKKNRYTGCLLSLIHSKKNTVTNEIHSNIHANFLLFDKTTNEIERFEPHGLVDNEITNSLNVKLHEMAKDMEYKYIEPTDKICPKKGWQALQVEEEDNYNLRLDTDPGGFCTCWTVFYADVRLSFPDLTQYQIVEKILSLLEQKSIYITEFIRNYIQFIVNKVSPVVNIVMKRHSQENITTEFLAMNFTEIVEEYLKDI